MRFSLVCMSWYSVAKDNKSKLAMMAPPPMLLIYTGEEDLWKLYNAMDNKILDLQLRVPNKRLCGSSKGWLIFADWNVVDKNLGVTLVNPFFRVKGRREKENSVIRLPPLTPPGWRKWVRVRRKNRDDWVERCQYYVHKATLSADPASDANDCIVVVIYEERLRLAFIRLGKDKTWTYIDERVGTSVSSIVINGCRGIEEVARVEDKFYGVNYGSELYSFKVTPQSSSDVKLAACGVEQKVFVKRYLVEAKERVILMVQRYIKFDYEVGKRVTRKFRIFELNLDECEWIEKQSLGDVALFVGDNSSVSVLASNFPTCQPNCIYFNHDRSRAGCEFPPHDFGVYNVVSQSFLDPYPTHVKTMVETTDRLPIWIMPTIQL
ncbi:hypothetical protein RchiOBHm_Chr6g0258051 [Rosa chinensis]|uniref:KIB1-4 beta-propeller domain-containing protein n=2 Tax=Rosa chinensis TaxID=74649 RepID=A0A2P6PMI0_ROSCH|nr:hypothetical protein RchiOBHm_Chr6g0258051 [Rosa chinensis]